jgi:small-conductance mechanosensitive channel
MNYLFYGNSIADWSTAFGITLAVALIGYSIVRYVACRLQAVAASTHTRVDDVVGSMIGATRWWFLLAAGFYIGSKSLVLSDREELAIHRAMVVVALVQAALWGDKAIRRYLRYHMERARQNNIASTTSAAVISFVSRALLWIVAVLMMLDNLGFNITTLVASLGIGGVAVALAVQNILGDIFGSLSIVLDKPFVVGDFIIVGDALGTVEYIGLKTTRIRALGGEQIVFSNAELLRSRIQNMQRLQDRRQAFVFRISYGCPAAKLRLVPKIVREAIEANEKVRFDRAHFRSYGEWGLEFEAVYFVISPDYNLMMDYQQEINLALYERFEQEGIEFALPRRIVELVQPEEGAQEEARPRQRFG